MGIRKSICHDNWLDLLNISAYIGKQPWGSQSDQKFCYIKLRSPSLSELTSIISYIELTHLDYDIILARKTDIIAMKNNTQRLNGYAKLSI